MRRSCNPHLSAVWRPIRPDSIRRVSSLDIETPSDAGTMDRATVVPVPIAADGNGGGLTGQIIRCRSCITVELKFVAPAISTL
jgi:hypothetical protein